MKTLEIFQKIEKARAGVELLKQAATCLDESHGIDYIIDNIEDEINELVLLGLFTARGEQND